MELLIAKLIEDSGFKKRYIAKQIGVNENTLTNWINGKSFPRLDKAVHLADILNCDIKDLYGK
ncbi:hypothetical protein GCM10007063_05390 [Lentibacillus kapialis]|uniref:HTH cro/C1-type domain-containing protein n=1 Tax=Lentibacillus kapialis TaxID=340214 RepID=A0A917PNE9_9BACI|nr:helix-turn-helix transcriptional regulator [Lentibacillus kapialis]GGJ85862.1 hypothetical protein GCM10007063_05390 [Lentibacillus kapialis]